MSNTAKQCDFCGRAFDKSYNLIRNLRTIHGVQSSRSTARLNVNVGTQITCNDCGKSFKTGRYLKRHRGKCL